jgi:hypothetical protein
VNQRRTRSRGVGHRWLRSVFDNEGISYLYKDNFEYWTLKGTMAGFVKLEAKEGWSLKLMAWLVLGHEVSMILFRLVDGA